MRHTICEFLDELNKAGLVIQNNVSSSALSLTIENLSFDNREEQLNGLFVCKGVSFKKEYLDSAIVKGAIAYLSEVDYGISIPSIIVSDVRKSMPILAKLFYDDAPSRVTSIGITGTKGKSTTAYFVKYILDEYFSQICKPKAAIISSVDTYDGVINMESHITTPEVMDVYKHFSNAEKTGISHLVMEVSSQALKVGRVSGINYDVACFTNIGIDHLSANEHLNFIDYFNSKLQIFNICKNACIFSGSDYYDQIYNNAKNKCNITTYGYKNTDTIYSESSYISEDVSCFSIKTPDYEGEMAITMPGQFNITNALAAIAIAYNLHIPYDVIRIGLYKAKCSGRMEVFTSQNKKLTVIVDYAHNELSFLKLYETVKKDYPDKQIITVFGCPGNKAQLRRHDLGLLAGKNSEYVVITEEDSGEEPFENISSEIAKYVEENLSNYMIMEDRGKAIRNAILENDFEKKIVLITGKGDETRQKRGKEYIPCQSDIYYAEKYINIYNMQH